MSVGKITEDGVKALLPKKEGAFVYWDDRLAGFGVKVTPTGKRVYVVQYRMGGRGHNARRYTIGSSEKWKAEAARREAKRLLSLVDAGEDVAATAREQKRVAVDLAFSDYVQTFCDDTLKREWPKSWQNSKRTLEIHASVHLKNKPLPDVTADDVRRLLARLEDSPATKRKLFAVLSYMFNKSVRAGLIQRSPLASLDPPAPVAHRDRTLNDEELRWLWEALAKEPEPYRGFAEDLVLTGQRRAEVAELPWSELNRTRREWHLPAKRAKNGCENIIPLTDAMIARFDKLAGGDKWPRSGLVRQSREKTPISGFSKLKRRLDVRMTQEATEAGASLEPWTLHDLRRTVATHLQRMGVPFEVVEHLLNHREKTRTGIGKVYQLHSFNEEKRRALVRWGTELERLVSGSESVVVPLRRA